MPTFYRKLDLAPEELVHPIFHECIPPLRYRGIRFDIDHPVNLEADRKSLFADSVSAADQVFQAPSSTFKILFEKLEDSTGKNHFAGQLVLDAVLRELFWRVVGALKPEKLSPHFHRSTAKKSFALRLARIFESHQSRHLSVPQMARALGLGQRTFEHQCLLMLQDFPARCFARFKINRAMTLLGETDMPIKEISHFLGFENPYHFSRVFRRFIGKSPSSLKRS